MPGKALDNRQIVISGRQGFAGMVLDLDARSLTDASGADVPLTPSEFSLMAAFVRDAGRALSRDSYFILSPGASPRRSIVALTCWLAACVAKLRPIQRLPG